MIFPTAALKRYAQVIGGSTPTPDERNWGGGLNWLTPTDVSLCHGDDVATSARTITAQGLAWCSAMLTPAGSVVVTTRAPIGNVAVTRVPSATNQGCRTLLPDPRLDARYLRYQLQTRTDELQSYGAGSTFLELSGSALGITRIHVPAFDRQRSIVDFLDRECDRIADLSESIDAQWAGALAWQAVRRQELITGCDLSGRRQGTGIPWIGSLPEGWEARRVGTLSSVRRGASPRPIDDPVYFDDAGTHGWVRISDVTASQKCLATTTQKLSGLGKSKSVPLGPGALILSIAASVGKAVITGIDCCVHDGFVYFPELGSDEVEWLYHVFACPDVFAGAGKLGTQLNLNTSTVAATVVPVPPLELRRSLCGRLNELDRLLMELREEQQDLQERLTEYRDALITEAVTGKLAVARLSEQQLDESAGAAMEGEQPEVLSA